MKLYALSIIVASIINFLTENRAEKYVFSDIKNISYAHIGKYKVKNKNILKELIMWGLYLCPFGINIIFTLIVAYASTKKNILDKFISTTNNYENDPNLLIDVYEQQKGLEKSMEDSLKIDGLKERKINRQIRLGYKHSDYRRISDKMYEDIKASDQAITFMKELEFYENLNLTPQERIKLLKEYKKAFLDNSKFNQEPIQKTLKLIDRNNNSNNNNELDDSKK